jgi:hypothetical protein
MRGTEVRQTTVCESPWNTVTVLGCRKEQTTLRVHHWNGSGSSWFGSDVAVGMVCSTFDRQLRASQLSVVTMVNLFKVCQPTCITASTTQAEPCALDGSTVGVSNTRVVKHHRQAWPEKVLNCGMNYPDQMP